MARKDHSEGQNAKIVFQLKHTAVPVAMLNFKMPEVTLCEKYFHTDKQCLNSETRMQFL